MIRRYIFWRSNQVCGERLRRVPGRRPWPDATLGSTAMAGIPISVRTARKADVRELARVLGRAFFDDPPTVWMLPDERSRERRAAGVFRAILRSHAMRYGGVDVVSDRAAIVGGAIWLPPVH